MKMISMDDIIEICHTNILPLKARGQGVAVAALRRVIDAAKEYVVDAELVKHGKWEWEPGYVGTQARCSVCKKSPLGFYSLSKLQIGRLPEYPFCPKCGARMDKEAEK